MSRRTVKKVEFTVPTVDTTGQVTRRQRFRATVFIEWMGSTPFEFVLVPGGAFWMGSCAGAGLPEEHPHHRVEISPFLLGRFPVTEAQWSAAMDDVRPERPSQPNRPADRVSWRDAGRFCERLSAAGSLDVRLPTEAEWEYSCRAGTDAEFGLGHTLTGELAAYAAAHRFRHEPAGTNGAHSTPTGRFPPPNAFGLYDMHGQVWEWSVDAWHDSYRGAPTDGSAWDSDADLRVVRGGSWRSRPEMCRSRTRAFRSSTRREDDVGLRLAADMPSPFG